MPEPDILLIGGGAAGLLAARTLARAGRRVLLLEGRNRLGGRIDTSREGGFAQPAEGGAEFLHGDVPLTRQLLAEAGMACHDTAGTTYAVEAGRARPTASFFDDMPLLLEKLRELPHDVDLNSFLVRYFPGQEHRTLREQVRRFAEGYDAADASRASTFALREEWSGTGAEDSPRPEGGYGRLVAWLGQQAQAAGAVIQLNTVVTEIHWQPGQVRARCADGKLVQARQVLLTVPLGVLQAQPGQEGYLHLKPELPQHRAAAQALGFGPVIKVLLEFDAPLWQQAAPLLAQPLPNLDFLFSDAPIPTWWTQLPDPRPVLTGWLAGPAAHRRRHTPDAELLAEALDSVAYLLGTTPAFLREHLRAHRVVNWAADPLARGAYSYSALHAAAHRATLATPVADTLFFAGEGVYHGPYIGTVEAALVSGAAAARQLLR
ncbi:monoamine oxidase [Hymenobacter luteus]|uniref:Tryptophan 2-monooxygenase n=2 Tax=Hymenobacter TaxID=89966 RepID=A0A7W9WDB0_9BACT|nr:MULTISPECIES: NAD(P)/FAD-dependent oxidoreductase [Hymenobacter]MBB4603088.1 monoamine oxidase [Hymenobacter latericoloratus]MBB6060953.1 monoamine oxidase [Hymenobacter luteus]